MFLIFYFLGVKLNQRNNHFNISFNIYFMSRRKLDEENIRKIKKSGDSYAVTLPINIMRQLGWQEKQKVIVEKRGEGILIKDWK